MRFLGAMRYLIVDDDTSYLSLVRSIASRDPDVELVATATVGHGLEEMVDRHRPDVVILDLAMPGVDGISLIPAAASRGAQVVVATMNDFAPVRELAIEAGATAVVGKSPVVTLFERARTALGVNA